MAVDINALAVEEIDRQNLQTAPRTVLEPNFARIRADILLLANALNAIQPGTIDPADLQINTSAFAGLLNGSPPNASLQQMFDVIDTKQASQNYTVSRDDFDGAFSGFSGTTVQELFDYCDGNLQPLITEQPGVEGLTFNFALVQPAGFDIFASLTNAERTFNANITRPTDFTRIELRANGTEIATYTTLVASTRNQLIPFIVQQQPDWATAVAAGGTDAAGRTIINMVLEGFLPPPANTVVSNTVQILIGAAAQQETIYHGLSIEPNGVTVPTFELTTAMALGNPATIAFTENPIALNTMPVYWHVLIPASFDSVAFTQVAGGLGNIAANNYFPNFSSPPTRTIGGETYNVYTSDALVPEFTAEFRLVLSDTT